MNSRTEKILNKSITVFMFALVMFATALLFYFLALRLGDVAKENQTYDRYISCVLSVPSVERDQKIIDRCWNQVQEDTGREVKRYD